MLRALFRFLHSNVSGNKIGRISKTKAKIKNPEIFSGHELRVCEA